MTAQLLSDPAEAAARPKWRGRPQPVLRLQAAVLRLATLVLLILVWATIAVGPLAHSDYVASPWRVLKAELSFVLTSSTLQAIGVTTERFLAAFAIAGILGTAVGLAIGRAGRHTYAVARDVAVVLYTLPLVPFYPLFVLWLGLGARSEVAFGAVHGFVPVILITMSAASRVDAGLVSAAQALGAGRLQRFGKVVLPAVVPDLVGGLRTGAALSLLGVLLGELMISVDGVGDLISQLIANLRPADLDAVILTVCVGAVLVNSAMTATERRCSRWR